MELQDKADQELIERLRNKYKARPPTTAVVLLCTAESQPSASRPFCSICVMQDGGRTDTVEQQDAGEEQRTLMH